MVSKTSVLLIGLVFALAAQALAQDAQVEGGASAEGAAEAPVTTSQEEAAKMVQDWAKQKAQEEASQQPTPEAPGPSPVVEEPIPAEPAEPSVGDDQKTVADRLFNRNKARERARAHLDKKQHDSGLGGAWDAPQEKAAPSDPKPKEQPRPNPSNAAAEKPLTPTERRAQEERREAERLRMEQRVKEEEAEERRQKVLLEEIKREQDSRTQGIYRVHSGHPEKAVLEGEWADKLSSMHFRMFKVEQDLGVNKAERIYNVGAHAITEMHGLARSMEFATHILPIDAPSGNINFDGSEKPQIPTPQQIRRKAMEEEKSRQQEQIQQMTQEEEVVL
mmetsp:Transcript_9927/g.24484  ORF Transcript_9927/g.24484 Transcript_9927/m.24484 type:complete len:333 (-) Transcript_9927:1389-2387(-)|eukprot:CAMPEP_0173441496 /NCGR_PEP_ID=MMETSP1357-20121228/23985_1 /TAXON_ID=77926 /ORGANISM="Hemiselmis rufescens, Strain PCC563" /LENGTH=332 /DNA_ID=CAMNT_0014407083 /DNA_START=17 /DNA_END=1015 /DNA_ORIENTATION=-